MSWENDDEATHIFGGNDPAVDAPWQVNVSETETRTMTAVDIGLEYGRGTLDANETYVWREGMRDWTPLGQCPELVPVLSQFAAKRQQSMAPPPPGRAATAPLPQSPGPLFAPTPSFVPPRPVAPPQPAAMQFSAPPALSSGPSPLRGPMQSHPAIPQGAFAAAAGAPRHSYPPGVGGPAMPDFSAQALAAGQLAEKKSSPLKMGLLVGGILGVLVVGGGAAFMLTRAPANGAASSAQVAVAAPSAKPEGEAEAEKPATDPVGDVASPDSAAATAKAATATAAPASAGAGDARREPTGSAPASERGSAVAALAPEPKKEDPKKEAKGSSDGPAFNVDAARSALSSAAGAASGCGRSGGPTGRGRATVTFASSGGVASASVDPPFAGTPVGSCALAAFRGARVPPFSGSAQSVTKSFNVK